MKVKKTTLHFGIDTKHFKNWSFENADQNSYSCNLYIFSVYSLNPGIFTFDFYSIKLHNKIWLMTGNNYMKILLAQLV